MVGGIVIRELHSVVLLHVLPREADSTDIRDGDLTLDTTNLDNGRLINIMLNAS